MSDFNDAKAKKVQSAMPGKKIVITSDDSEKEFSIKRAKSISATKTIRINEENKDDKTEDVIEVPEETFMAKKEVPKMRKNSVGELLNKKISVESALSARKKENIPENHPAVSELAENENNNNNNNNNNNGEKENEQEEKEKEKENRGRERKKRKQERREKRKEAIEEQREEGGESENLDFSANREKAERKNSINEILTRRSSIGIVSPRAPIIVKQKSYGKAQSREDLKPEGKSIALPQNESSGNKVSYHQIGSQLHYHTATGNWDLVKDLLDTNPEAMEHRSDDGRTILHVSSSLGHLHIVKGLLERNVDINTTMNNGLTPLMLCSAQGKPDVVQLLLDFGASYCTQTVKDGYTALHLACMHRQVKSAQVLLNYIKEQTESLKGKKKKDSKLIMSGSLPLPEYIELRSTKGYSAFHLATVEGDLAILQLLVEFGADYKAPTSKKWTPLHFAAHQGNLEICQFLTNLDSNLVDLKNETKEKPFDIAVYQKHEHLLEILTPKVQSKPKKPKKKKEKKEKKKNNNNNNNEPEVIIEMPEFEGDRNECLIDRITKRPALLKEMKEDANIFLAQIPPEGQMLLFNEAKENPLLLEELLSIGREVLISLIEENPHLLLATVQSPISILKKVKTPAKLFKLLKQIEENPMMFMKDDCREDPELFFLQQLRDNPFLRYLVVTKLREKKPNLLPLIKVLIGIEAEEITEPEEDKSVKTKMTNRLMKATVSKYLKKLIDSDGKDVNIAGIDSESLQQVKDIMTEEDVGKLMAKNGMGGGPLFTLTEIPDEEELPFDDLD